MYVNGKMIPVKLFQECGEAGQRRMMEKMNASMIYLIYCKNFCKCHSVPPG
jgi:hypothetical protein